jgi:hypothetical protein
MLVFMDPATRGRDARRADGVEGLELGGEGGRSASRGTSLGAAFA